MAIRVGINGLGRIGRLVLRRMIEDPDFEVVGINDLSDKAAIAHLIKYDSSQGKFNGTVEIVDEGLLINGKLVRGFTERDPEKIPWAEYNIDLAIEATGHYKDREGASKYLAGGAKKVIITAPGKDCDATIVMGVNDDTYDPATMNIVSNASCTTNCLAPVAKVLNDEFGIKRGFMNTIHAYTSDQKIIDHRHKDLRRARSGAANIAPTTTGAAKAVSLVIPELAGKLDGFATRVPVADGSMVDLTVQLERPATKEEINAAMKAAAEGALKGVLEYTEDPIVSTDIIGNDYSSIFDAQLTMVLGGEGDMVKVVSWYDNEWGYSCRVVDLARIMF